MTPPNTRMRASVLLPAGVVWFLSSGAVLGLICAALTGLSWRSLATNVPSVALVGMHMLIGAVVLTARARGVAFSARTLGALSAAGLGAAAFAFVFAAVPVNRAMFACVALVSFPVNWTLAATLAYPDTGRGKAALVGAVSALAASLTIVAVAAVVPALRVAAAARLASPVTTQYARTSRYSLEQTYVRALERPAIPGGGLTTLGDDMLLLTGNGDLYLVPRAADSGARIRKLGLRAPVNTSEFNRDAPAQANRTYFRAADVLVSEDAATVRVFVSHHYWFPETASFVLRVSMAVTTRDSLTSDVPRVAWKTVFESTPSLPLKNTLGEFFFNGSEMGGRLQLLDATHLLVTVGDHEFDGWRVARVLAQDPAASYGKTILVDLAGLAPAVIYSMGHRNPQGLFIDKYQTIWETEHGPQGGDELNVIRRGKNYGWPLATLGTEYGMTKWPPAARPGQHDGYEHPIYAWLPSVGVSNVIRVEGALFESWRDDLLVATLPRGALLRLRIHEGRVVFAEPIEIGRRIRDVVEDSRGRIVLWTDEGDLVYLKPELAASPRELAFAPCLECHNIRTGEPGHARGPDLLEVFGREIGTFRGFQFSPALKRIGGTWKERNLRAFLASPETFAPGTYMTAPGITDTARINLIVAYLKGLRRL